MFRKTREKSPYYLLAMDFGYTLLASLLVFGWFGRYLDGRFGTGPWLLLGGVVLGIAVGFNNLFRRLNLLEHRQRKSEKRFKDSKHHPNEPGGPNA